MPPAEATTAGSTGATPTSRGAAFLALHSHERWAGDGWPAGLPAEAIPIGSRILAVAVAWAALTASGTRGALAGGRHARARGPVGELPSTRPSSPPPCGSSSDEEGFASEPAFQPKLHRLPGPAVVAARRALPGLLPRLAST